MWNQGTVGPRDRLRALRTTPWADTRDNYPAAVALSIDDLVTINGQSELAGRIILWHGEPGVGKTSAIRSLMHEWRDR